jgi:hypothetical protein
MGKCILAGHPPAGNIGYGTYTGDGSDYTTPSYRTISLGVTPKWVLVFDVNGCVGFWGSSTNMVFGGLVISGHPCFSANRPSIKAVEIVSGGFRVTWYQDSGINYVQTNYPGRDYNYIYGT